MPYNVNRMITVLFGIIIFAAENANRASAWHVFTYVV